MSLFNWLVKNNSNLKIVGSIFLAGYLVNDNLVSTMERINQPLVDKIASIEKIQSENEKKQAAFASDVKDDRYKMRLNTVCLDNIINYLNSSLSKEFVKPDELYEKKEK